LDPYRIELNQPCNLTKLKISRFGTSASQLKICSGINDFTYAGTTRFYPLKSGHAPTGVYLKRFGHREDDKCWWCGGTTAQTRGHLFRHCSRWKEQQELWREVGKAMGWKVSRCRNIQISELFSMETCDQAVMDFLAATDVGKFPPK